MLRILITSKVDADSVSSVAFCTVVRCITQLYTTIQQKLARYYFLSVRLSVVNRLISVRHRMVGVVAAVAGAAKLASCMCMCADGERSATAGHCPRRDARPLPTSLFDDSCLL